MLCSLADAVVHPVLSLEDLACTRIDLPGHKKGNQLLREVIKVDISVDEIVFMTAIAVTNKVGVVFKY